MESHKTWRFLFGQWASRGALGEHKRSCGLWIFKTKSSHIKSNPPWSLKYLKWSSCIVHLHHLHHHHLPIQASSRHPNHPTRNLWDMAVCTPRSVWLELLGHMVYRHSPPRSFPWSGYGCQCRSSLSILTSPAVEQHTTDHHGTTKV